MDSYKEIIYSVGIAFMFALIGVLFINIVFELIDYVCRVFNV